MSRSVLKANALDEKEAQELYDTFHVAGSGIALAQMGNANLNPWSCRSGALRLE